MRYIKYAFILLALFGTTSHADSSSSASSMPDANSAGAFVQDFYDWYAPMAYRQKNSLPWETAITLKSDLFSTRLSVALKRDKFSFANPDGSYTALRMEKDYASKEWDDAPMPNSIFFTQRGHAIHGSFDKRLGRPVSHGCVRLKPGNAAKLFSLVERTGLAHTKVIVSGRIR